jgi:alpha-beta hydrolase superfamily lysophospholipase
MDTKSFLSRVSGFAMAAAFSLIFGAPSQAETIRQDYEAGQFTPQPISVWRDSTQRPRAVAITVHGLVMHGGTYDALARQLVTQGFIVAAPDMRGYGRWISDKQADPEVNYEDTFNDLVALAKKLKEQHPDLSLFCVGESLGADMCLRLASSHPELVDGLVLSSPAIKRQSFVGPILTKAPRMLKPSSQIDLAPYIRKFASEDPQIIEGAMRDPLVRKKLSVREIWRSLSVFKATLDYARNVPSSVPVLVIQGSQDRVVKSNAVVTLLGTLKSSDQTVRWFSNRGHLLLETDYVRPDTMQIVTGWLKEHSTAETAQVQTQVEATPLDANSTPKSSSLNEVPIPIDITMSSI